MNEAAACDTPGTVAAACRSCSNHSLPLPACDGALLDVDIDDENRLALEAGVARAQGEERPGEEAGGDDEREGQRDLQHDQAVSDAETAVVGRRRGSAP